MRVVALAGRLLPVLVVALAAPVAALDPGPDRPATAEVAVRAAAHPDYGRLVLEWPHAVEVALSEAPGAAALTFSSRMDADLAPARTPLAPWLRAIDLGDDGRSLRVVLAPGVRPRLSQYRPELVVLDLAHPGADEGPAVALRTGRHEGFVRLVFDWGAAVGFAAEQIDRELTITFARPGRIDGADLGRRLRPWIDEASAQRVGGGTRVRLRLHRGIEARAFAVEGRQVVVDLHLPEGPGEASAAGADPEPALADAGHLRSGALPRPPPARPATPAAADRAEPADGAMGDIQPPSAAGEAPAVIAGSPPAVPEAAPMPVRDAAGAVLEIGWSRPVAAAAFVRGGHLWLVFDAAASEALSPLPPPLGPALAARLGPGERLGTPSGTALRFALREPAAIAAAREGATWRFTVDDDAPTPAAVPQRRLLDPVRLRLEAGGGGGLVRLIDPAVGDRLIVWPLLEPARGQPERRLLVEVELLASAQGIVWRPLADRLQARRVDEGIELGTAGGLLLSRIPDALGAAAPKAERSLADEAEASPAPLGLAGWALRPGEGVAERRADLMRDVVRAPEEQRNQAELELARFFLAQAMAAETLAVLVGSAEGADATKLARRGLFGAAAVLAGQLERAAGALGTPEFDHDPELALWRAVLAAAQDDWPRAARELGRAEATLDGYPPPLQMQLGLPAAMIAIEDGRPEIAISILDRLAARRPNAAEQARLIFVRGLVEARIGAVEQALLLWRSLDEQQVPDEIRVKAAHSRVRLLLDAGRIGADEALEELRPARPLWRGHPWEASMLDALAEVHLRTGDAASAIRTWREALRLDPAPRERERMATAIGDVFERAILGGDTGPMGAVRALALYRDLPELVPEGAAGQELRRRLARRLAELDLVAPAAALLEEVLQGELTTLERAHGGLELATLRLDQPDPTAALAALDASAGPALPPTLAAERGLARARALLALERPEAALAVIAGREDAAAQRLRATVQWSSRDWKGTIETIEPLLRDRPGNGVPLSPDEEELVLQLALANARLGRMGALARLRARFAEAMGGREGEHAFLVATLGGEIPPRREAALAAIDRRIDELRSWLEQP